MYAIGMNGNNFENRNGTCTLFIFHILFTFGAECMITRNNLSPFDFVVSEGGDVQ